MKIALGNKGESCRLPREKELSSRRQSIMEWWGSLVLPSLSAQLSSSIFHNASTYEDWRVVVRSQMASSTSILTLISVDYYGWMQNYYGWMQKNLSQMPWVLWVIFELLLLLLLLLWVSLAIHLTLYHTSSLLVYTSKG